MKMGNNESVTVIFVDKRTNEYIGEKEVVLPMTNKKAGII